MTKDLLEAEYEELNSISMDYTIGSDEWEKAERKKMEVLDKLIALERQEIDKELGLAEVSASIEKDVTERKKGRWATIVGICGPMIAGLLTFGAVKYSVDKELDNESSVTTDGGKQAIRSIFNKK